MKKPSHIAAFLVPPYQKDAEEAALAGVELPLRGILFEKLAQVFINTDSECDLPIRFVSDGTSQFNAARSEILDFVDRRDLASGRVIATRLHAATTGRSGLGLLFLMLRDQGADSIKLVVSRFPADQGILAETSARSLQVEFVERVFMKSASTYKAALYVAKPMEQDFWKGMATDKQVNTNKQLASYWIREFLLSEFLTTSGAGTMRLARAVRQASRERLSAEAKNEIVAAAQLIPSLGGKVLSIDEIVGRLGLGDEAQHAIVRSLPRPELRADSFTIDAAEFRKHAAYSSVELANGAVLLAPADRFSEVFREEVVDAENEVSRFTTEDKVVNRKVRGKL